MTIFCTKLQNKLLSFLMAIYPIISLKVRYDARSETWNGIESMGHDYMRLQLPFRPEELENPTHVAF